MKLSMVKERVNPCRDSEGNLYTTPRLVDRSSAQCLSRARVAAMAWQCRCSAHYRVVCRGAGAAGAVQVHGDGKNCN